MKRTKARPYRGNKDKNALRNLLADIKYNDIKYAQSTDIHIIKLDAERFTSFNTNQFSICFSISLGKFFTRMFVQI